ncbi:MAG: hypothetical protein QXX36_01900 [Candidatus Rehaiarchaeum fermentans]|nr:hypothetical protein [Candidatus Rehaiarchaeum fermentans]
MSDVKELLEELVKEKKKEIEEINKSTEEEKIKIINEAKERAERIKKDILESAKILADQEYIRSKEMKVQEGIDYYLSKAGQIEKEYINQIYSIAEEITQTEKYKNFMKNLASKFSDYEIYVNKRDISFIKGAKEISIIGGIIAKKGTQILDFSFDTILSEKIDKILNEIYELSGSKQS